MEKIHKGKLDDLIALHIKNPYRDGSQSKRSVEGRILCKQMTMDEIIQSMIKLGNFYAQKYMADVDPWINKNLMASTVLGSLRYVQGFTNKLERKDHYKNLIMTAHDIQAAFKKHQKWNPIGVAAAAHRCESYLDDNLKGRSPILLKAKAEIWSAAFGYSLPHAMQFSKILREQNVLIHGDTGTGKEAAAQALMEAAFQDNGAAPPINKQINVAAIPKTLIESMLFGYVKGAFTGADRDSHGLIKSADGGILFLDEIGELPKHLQAKFLRVMETQNVLPVGATDEITVNVRYIAATHRNIISMVKENKFRPDFFYRLCGAEVTMPNLSEIIKQDLPFIVEAIVKRSLPQAEHNDIDAEIGGIVDYLSLNYQDHKWPGNVRELKNVIDRCLLIGPGQSPPRLEYEPDHETMNTDDIPKEIVDVSWTEKQMVSWYRKRAFDKHGNKTKAARALEISARTIERFNKEK
jgi:transcriptional regulator with PAS, ATPase and Fis domain